MEGSTRAPVAFTVLCLVCLPLPAAGQGELVDAEQLVRQVLRTWKDHEVGRLDGLFAEDGVYEDVPPKMTYKGADEIQGFMAAIWSWAPDIEFSPVAVSQTGDTVVVEWIMKGTQTGSIGAIPASGRAFTARGASVAKVEDGRIVRYSDYYDLATILVQFGVRFAAPPPPEAAAEPRGGEGE